MLSELKDWLDATFLTVLPKSAMGKALKYVINQWQALTNYLLDGRITDITNNAAERALRCVELGRKNWMQIGAEAAGKPAAVLMSIIQTCKEQGVNAVEYLRDVLVQVSQPGSAARIDDLLPAAWKNCPAAKERVAHRRRATASAVQSLVYSELS